MKEGIKINPFKALNKMSTATVVFGSIVLFLAALMTEIHCLLIQIELGMTALVFLNLFFYSLIMDKISEIEKRENDEEV